MTAIAAGLFSVGLVAFTVLITLWRALRLDPGDAPLFLSSGQGLAPCVAVMVSSVAVIALGLP